MDTLIAAPLTSGSHPNSNAPGRRQEDDTNLVIFQQNQRNEVRDLKGIAGAIPANPGMKQQNYVTHSLTGEGHDASEDGTGRGTPLIPLDFRQTSRGDKLTNKRSTGSGGPPGSGVGNEGDPAFTVSGRQQGIGTEVGVRRLTPTECERLQGFPDNWTLGVDSKRYKALGNAVAVPVIEWIGRRLAPYGHKVKGGDA